MVMLLYWCSETRFGNTHFTHKCGYPLSRKGENSSVVIIKKGGDSRFLALFYTLLLSLDYSYLVIVWYLFYLLIS